MRSLFASAFSIKSLAAGLVGLAAAFATPSPAEAGGFRHSSVGISVGFGGPVYGGFYGGPYYGGGYYGRPVGYYPSPYYGRRVHYGGYYPYRRHYARPRVGYGYRYGYGYDPGAAVAAGIVGLATGAIIGSAIAGPRSVAPYRVAPRRVAPVHRASWAAWCSQRYRSFDPRTGTFMGYDGIRRACVVR